MGARVGCSAREVRVAGFCGFFAGAGRDISVGITMVCDVEREMGPKLVSDSGKGTG